MDTGKRSTKPPTARNLDQATSDTLGRLAHTETPDTHTHTPTHAATDKYKDTQPRWSGHVHDMEPGLVGILWELCDDAAQALQTQPTNGLAQHQRLLAAHHRRQLAIHIVVVRGLIQCICILVAATIAFSLRVGISLLLCRQHRLG